MRELQRESRMGAIGSETRQREVRVIDLADFDARRAEIADHLWDAAVDVGFFQPKNHGIDLATTREAFAMTERFFAPTCSSASRRTSRRTESRSRAARARNLNEARGVPTLPTRTPRRLE